MKGHELGVGEQAQVKWGVHSFWEDIEVLTEHLL